MPSIATEGILDSRGFLCFMQLIEEIDSDINDIDATQM
jgi:hypothetical protein